MNTMITLLSISWITLSAHAMEQTTQPSIEQQADHSAASNSVSNVTDIANSFYLIDAFKPREVNKNDPYQQLVHAVRLGREADVIRLLADGVQPDDLVFNIAIDIHPELMGLLQAYTSGQDLVYE